MQIVYQPGTMPIIDEQTNHVITVHNWSIVGISVTFPFDLYSSHNSTIACKYLAFKLN